MGIDLSRVATSAIEAILDDGKPSAPTPAEPRRKKHGMRALVAGAALAATARVAVSQRDRLRGMTELINLRELPDRLRDRLEDVGLFDGWGDTEAEEDLGAPPEAEEDLDELETEEPEAEEDLDDEPEAEEDLDDEPEAEEDLDDEPEAEEDVDDEPEAEAEEDVDEEAEQDDEPEAHQDPDDEPEQDDEPEAHQDPDDEPEQDDDPEEDDEPPELTVGAFEDADVHPERRPPRPPSRSNGAKAR